MSEDFYDKVRAHKSLCRKPNREQLDFYSTFQLDVQVVDGGYTTAADIPVDLRPGLRVIDAFLSYRGYMAGGNYAGSTTFTAATNEFQLSKDGGAYSGVALVNDFLVAQTCLLVCEIRIGGFAALVTGSGTYSVRWHVHHNRSSVASYRPDICGSWRLSVIVE